MRHSVTASDLILPPLRSRRGATWIRKKKHFHSRHSQKAFRDAMASKTFLGTMSVGYRGAQLYGAREVSRRAWRLFPCRTKTSDSTDQISIGRRKIALIEIWRTSTTFSLGLPATQGWTFQEILLVTRVVYFRDSQIYWPCRTCGDRLVWNSREKRLLGDPCMTPLGF